jgi:putative hemolysin
MLDQLIPPARVEQRPLTRLLYPLIDKPFALGGFSRFYSGSQQRFAAPGATDWFDACLAELGVKYEVEGPGLPTLPAGPVIVVANHPFGILDAIVLGAVFAKQGRPMRVLANSLLSRFKELDELIIPVDPYARETSARSNIGPMRDALRLLKKDGVLLTFPSGAVASWNMKKLRVEEAPWQENLGALIRRSGAQVVPVFFQGSNSKVFHTLGSVHPLLRTSLLMRELMNKAGKQVSLTVGRPVPARRIAAAADDAALMSYLRMHTLLLGKNQANGPVPVPESGPASEVQPLMPAAPACESRLAQEVAALTGTAAELAGSNGVSVFIATAPQIPYLLKEIGRLREVTFRAVGEGTGRAVDLDRFDEYYEHLFLWDSREKAVMGAYRLGRTDSIMAAHGPKGLYTTSLFRFKPELLRRLTPALELGRSFIRPEYQGHRQALPLLWRGVGEYVVRHPRYRLLFGPVSISREYTDLSRTLMLRYLRKDHYDDTLSRLVRPRSPFRERGEVLHGGDFEEAALQDVEAIGDLVSALERDGKGLPVLLKHYLKMNARLLSFNVDAQFSDVVDGLILVDLLKTDRPHLRRHLGDEGSSAFLAWHGISDQAADSVLA